MDVIVIESEAFSRLERMFIESQEIIKVQTEMITRSKIGLITAKQVADLTGYDVRTINLRKSEIGYMYPLYWPRSSSTECFIRISVNSFGFPSVLAHIGNTKVGWPVAQPIGVNSMLSLIAGAHISERQI
jgi:hypothetical protein